jgi:hypothetical protein
MEAINQYFSLDNYAFLSASVWAAYQSSQLDKNPDHPFARHIAKQLMFGAIGFTVHNIMKTLNIMETSGWIYLTVFLNLVTFIAKKAEPAEAKLIELLSF